jgi:hypothetical protein
MLLTDVIARHRLPIEVVTLDTGRLPPETSHSWRRRSGAMAWAPPST